MIDNGYNEFKEAKKRVKARKEFYEHLGAFAVMSMFFFLLNAATSFSYWWFYWPIMGWGIGIAFHYIDVFGLPGIGALTKEWEERAIADEMERLRRHEEIEEKMQKGGFSQYKTPKQQKAEEDSLELRELQRVERKKWDEQDLV